ncbi:MAG: helix-turn-helix domain-containing protein [Acidobacteria bacterium]|nr:helix-turn-helix domain-containing protein [Acidobacteriota bacterium]
MAERIVAVKEVGASSHAEGILARFARIYGIRSAEEAALVAKVKPEIVLLDLAMPHVDANDVLRVLRRHQIQPVVLLNCSQTPRELLSQIRLLADLRAKPSAAPASIRRIAGALGLSQEALARILGVSAKTVQRWLKGTKPKSRPELVRLGRLVSLLEEALPHKQAIQSYLNHPNPSFSGERPIDLLLRGEFERVEADVQAMQEGVYD